MTYFQKFTLALIALCAVLMVATYLINKDTEKVVNKVVSEMKAEKAAKEAKAKLNTEIESTVIYQGETIKK